MRQVVLDTETTGLDFTAGHRIVEIGGVEIVNRQLTGRHIHLYLNPDRDSDPEALNVHGLTTEFLSDKPRFPEIVEEFLAFVDGAEIIIHNAPFDTGFLDAELARVNLSSLTHYCGKVTDSLLAARELHPGRRNSLDALCERYGISNAHRVLHGALLDSELLADVWLAMTRGQDDMFFHAETQPVATPQSEAIAASPQKVLALPVLAATKEEQSAHEDYLHAMEDASERPVLWRRYSSS